MTNDKLNKVLARCDKPATHFSLVNGYRTCADHAHTIDTPYREGMPETEDYNDYNIKGCDYRLDGLGALNMAARYDRYHELYLDYFNNFITTGRFAEHYNLDTETAAAIIDLGRELHVVRRCK